jgi:uncharacterized integral membrane protein
MADKDDRGTGDQRGVSPRLVGGIVLALVAIDFVVQNRERLRIHFLFFDFESRVWTALVVTSVLAILAAELVGGHMRRNRKRK